MDVIGIANRSKIALRRIVFSCGDHYYSNTSSSSQLSNQATGTLAQVMTDEKGTADFRFLTRRIRVPDIIGRSFVVQTSDSQYDFFFSY